MQTETQHHPKPVVVLSKYPADTYRLFIREQIATCTDSIKFVDWANKVTEALYDPHNNIIHVDIALEEAKAWLDRRYGECKGRSRS